MSKTLLQTNLSEFPVKRGKVRDVYDLGEQLLIVTTDRISAFDWIMPNGIPEKGKILTQMTRFWLDFLQVPNHLVSAETSAFPASLEPYSSILAGRSMLVRKTLVYPVECVVRGYLAGSGWKDYRASGTVCGVELPMGLIESSKLPEPIFTPATKAETGHDENIPFELMASRLGSQVAATLRTQSIDIYRRARDYAESRGILLADTKFEWGHLPSGEILLIDEVLTPDSSRFWPLDAYQPGSSPPSFDKQYLRDWLETTSWDKNSPPPDLPREVIEKTGAKYIEAFERLTGKKW
jgi:phosphoribosylaminoimidazole-succinocarboxamide synthase